MAYTSFKDYNLEIARGQVPGVSELHKFGRNPQVGTGAYEDIWAAAINLVSGNIPVAVSFGLRLVKDV